MPTVTNFGDVVTQGNTTATGNLTVQGTGTSSFSSALSAVTMAGTLAVTGVTTHSGNIVPSSDFVCGIGTAGSRFGNIYAANTNIYTIANIFTANILSINVTNIATFQNSVHHFQNTFSTGFTQTTGIIIPTSSGISGLGGPSLLFANAFLQTANIGSSTAQLSMNVTGNVLVSNSINVANLLCVTANASFMNIITGGYANMASINVFTGANATYLTVQTLANVYGTANIVTSNIQTANIVFANVLNLNVSTGANTTYLAVTTLANVFSANIITSNIRSANIVTANVQNLNVSTGANTTYLSVQFLANVFSANIVTSNIQTANVGLANVQSLNVSTGANTTYLSVQFLANVFSANLVTSNIQTANIVTANVQNLNVSTGANTTYLAVTTLANVFSANIVTSNIQTANIVTSNVQSLNVSTGANTTYLAVTTLANVFSANIVTSNIQTANIVTANVQNLNVSTGANTTYLAVTTLANVFSANIVTSNIQTANIVTANVQNLNVSTGANISTLFVQTFANILSSNIVSSFSSTINVSAFANVFTANIFKGNVQTTFNVSGLMSATLYSGNASALSNINASNVTMGILPFRNDAAIGQGATAISINGSTGINNQYLSSTGTSLQWVGPPAAIFSQVPTSTNQIFYNSGNVAIGPQNWTLFGVGYNTFPGVPLDVYGGAGSFSNVSDATYTGTIRIMQNAASWGGNGGLEFKTGTNIAGAGHRLVTTEIVSSSGVAPLIFQYRANTPVWSNAMVIHNGTTTPGYVGIGTMAPLFQFHIYQTSVSAPATSTLQFSSTSQSAQFYLANPAGITTILYMNGSAQSADGPANSATLRNNAGDLRLAAASTQPYIYLETSTSRVGISTSTPTQTLDVAGYARVGSISSDTARLILGRASGATNFDYASMIESVSTYASNYQSTLKFYTHGTATTGADPTLAMTINPTQQVGIGIAPGYKFHVDNGANSGINAVVQASTITAGNTTSIILGKALSTNNSATFVWNHVGEGLATNYLGIGYYGGDNKLCVTASGNVGIGVTNPSYTLQVAGSVGASTSFTRTTPSTGVAFAAPGTGLTATSYNLILVGGNDTGDKLVVFVNGSTRTADNGVNNVTIRNDGGSLILGNVSYPTLVYGSVGMGLTGPTEALDVNGNIRSRGVIYNKDGTNGYAQMSLGTATIPGYVAFHKTDGTRAGYIGWQYDSVNLVLQVENGYTGYVVPGNLGVGMAPTFKLDVSGGIRAAVNGSTTSAEGTTNAITAYAPSGISGNASIWMGFDPTNDCGYINSARSGLIRPVCLQTRGGNVGVGTTNPGSPLLVYGTSTAYVLTVASPTATLDFQPGSRFGTAAGGFTTIDPNGAGSQGVGIWDLLVVSGSCAIGSGYAQTAPPANGLIVAGSVGIGITNPKFLLNSAQDISLTADINDNTAQFAVTGATTPNKRMVFGYDTQTAGNGYGFIKAGNLNVAFTSIALQPNGGSVGIGKTNPGYNLDVSGTFNVSGASRMTSTLQIQYDNPTITFSDTDHMTAYWHCNSNLMYLLRGGVNAGPGGWSQINGQWPVYFNLSDNAATFGGTIYSVSDITTAGSLNMTGNATRIKFNSTAAWSGDAGSSFGKLEYHAERWYINAGSNSDRIVQFRRGATDVSSIDNSGNFSGTAATATTATNQSGGTVAATTGTFSSTVALTATNASLGLNRGAVWFNGIGDTNHYLYNNYNNRDGAGGFDGMKWNTFNGLWVRGGNSGANTGFFMNSSGNVGIGFTSPTYRLDVSGAIRAQGQTSVFNRMTPYSSSYGASYSVAPIEVREYNLEGATGTEMARAPRIGFHWGSVVASSIAVESSGRIGIFNNPGTSYESFICGNCYTDQYYRVIGNGGLYFENWGGGWVMTDSTYIRSYNDKTIYSGGQIAAGGDIIAYFSDMRLKKNIEPITNAIDKIKTLSTFTYEVNAVGASYGLEEHVRNSGFSAQEVQKIMPEVIRLAPFDMGEKNEVTGVVESKSGENYMTLLYDKMAPLIVAALKEEVQKREDLEKEVAELKQLVQNLLARQ